MVLHHTFANLAPAQREPAVTGQHPALAVRRDDLAIEVKPRLFLRQVNTGDSRGSIAHSPGVVRDKHLPLHSAQMEAAAQDGHALGLGQLREIRAIPQLVPKEQVGLLSREEFYARNSEEYVEETFGGSLPAFLAAFGTRRKFSEKEIEELQKVIDSMRG